MKLIKGVGSTMLLHTCHNTSQLSYAIGFPSAKPISDAYSHELTTVATTQLNIASSCLLESLRPQFRGKMRPLGISL